MNILLSNDDGISAQGMNTLYQQLQSKHTTTIVAPDQERSSCGHAITLKKAVKIFEKEKNKYACSGLPSDCILMGIGKVFKMKKPDLIISGINHGANLGQDRFYSGTIAAAREGAFRGVPSIAVSLVLRPNQKEHHFENAALIIDELIIKGIQHYIPKMCLLNINIPNLPKEEIAGHKSTYSGHQLYTEEIEEKTDEYGNASYFIGGKYEGHTDLKGSDANAVSENFVSLELQNLVANNQRDLSQFEDFIKQL